MPIIQAQKDIQILVDEDNELDTVSEGFIGRKAYSLFRLRDFDVPVPPFFAISSTVFTQYIHDTLRSTSAQETSANEIRKQILEGDFTPELQTEIMEGYSRLSGFSDTWVAVRSSAVLPQSNKQLSFAGMLDTVLNVKGLENILASIQQIYASLFTPEVLEYLRDFRLSISDIKVAIIVQKMVQAESSGIVFTIDPISQMPNYLTIEAVFGLGDVIASGDITPDQYILNKKTLSFIEKTIVPQEWMMVRNMKRKADGPTGQRVQISRPWQHQQKLENRYIQELAKIAILIEKKIGEPQDIEWVCEGGRLWLLQCSSVQPISLPRTIQEEEFGISPSIVQSALDIALKEEGLEKVKQQIAEAKEKREKDAQTVVQEFESPATSDRAEAKKEVEAQTQAEEKLEFTKFPVNELFTAKPLTRQVLQGIRSTRESIPELSTSNKRIAPQPGERLFLTGIGASSATARGTVIIIRDQNEINDHEKEITVESVIVIPDHIDGIDRILNRAGAVIVDTGGMTSDIATRCREHGVPCIMGTHVASRMLKTGEVILVDGTIGAVYGVRDIAADYRTSVQESASAKQPKVETPPAAQKQGFTTSQEVQITQSETEKPPTRTATRIFLNASFTRNPTSITSALTYADGICTLPVELFYSEIGKHPEALIADDKRAELIERLQNGVSLIAETAQSKAIVLSLGSLTVGQYKELADVGTFEDIEAPNLTQTSRGLVRLLQHPKEVSAMLKAIRKVRNVDGWRTVSLAVDYPASPNHLAEFKKLLTTAGLRRSSTFKLYLSISTPSEAMIVEEFVKIGIDGIIIDITLLAKHMMALTSDDSSVIKVIETIKSAATDIETILLLPKDSSSLLEQVFKLGFYGVAVSGTEIKDARETVARLEADRVFGR